MLLIIAIVGTTVAPWQLFFQQSYVIDKRITPRFIQYERIDLWIGILFVMIGAVAMMAFTAATFAGHPEFGQFSDAGGVASGLEKYVGAVPAVLFALALFDACIIGASAVSLATAYAVSDVLDLRHSLHRKPTEAKAFYAVYCGLIALAAALVLTPGTPLGLLTNAVQTLAGVLLPSATVFLLLLCNDQAVGALGQRSRAEFLHRRSDRRLGDAVDHPDRLGALPGDRQRNDHRDSCRGRRDRARHLSHHTGRSIRQAGRPVTARYLANAAARQPPSAASDHPQPDLAVGSAGVSDRRGRACSGAHRNPGDDWRLTCPS
jgi:hypothetical protein